MEIVKPIEQIFESFLEDNHKPGDLSMPLVSPRSIKRLADILNVNLIKEGYQVPNLKSFLKTFSLQYRMDKKITAEEITTCLELVQEEREKHLGNPESFPQKDLDAIFKLEGDQLYCIECGLCATKYCTNCEDCLCEQCATILHAKGKRHSHFINSIIPCNMCSMRPSRLQCTYDFKSYCMDCYTRKHAGTLPTGFDFKPLRIDYSLIPSESLSTEPLTIRRSLALTLLNEPILNVDQSRGDDEARHPLGDAWHPFTDASGLVYYYNFDSQESMRRPYCVQALGFAGSADPMQREAAIKRIIFQRGPKVLDDTLTKAQLGILSNALGP